MWQPIYDELLQQFPFIEFHRGLPAFLREDEFFDIRINNLIVCDDLMTEAANDQRICDLYTKGSHHGNINVICTLQNVFNQGKVSRSISLNSHKDTFVLQVHVSVAYHVAV